MKQEYTALRGLQQNTGYKILEELWMHQVAKIEESRDRAATKGNESAWRYWAGQEKGFKLAMTAVQRALTEMEKDNENIETESSLDKLLDEIRPK